MKEKKERNNLIIKFRKQGKTISEIAEVFNVSYYAIRDILRREEFEKKNNAPLLEGRDYKRNLIRKYFDYTCQKCGKIWQKKQRRFDVHHFGKGSRFSKRYDNFKKVEDIINKVTLLCHKCHLNLKEHRQTMSENHKTKK